MGIEGRSHSKTTFRSCLQQMCPNKLQDHLDLQASGLTSHDQVKSEVLAHLEKVETRKEAQSGAVPMDVDSLAKGMGKGKYDKGKGKGKMICISKYIGMNIFIYIHIHRVCVHRICSVCIQTPRASHPAP